MELTPEVLRQLGPIGTLVLMAWMLYLQYTRHGENQKKLDDILDQTHRINGRVSRLEEWRLAHTNLAIEREAKHKEMHDERRRELDSLWEKLDER